MGRYIVKRFVSLIITILLIAFLTFVIMQLIPGGPFTSTVDDKDYRPELLDRLNEKYGLNDPIIVQFGRYMKGLVSFDLGPSYSNPGVSVNEILSDGFPYSAKLGFFSYLLILFIGIPIGVIAGTRHKKFADNAVMVVSLIGVTLPGYVIATVVIYIFVTQLNLLPTAGLSTPRHYIAPLLSMGGAAIAFLSRLTRSSMVDVLNQDYIRFARANGLLERKIIYKHALRNAFIPVITCIGPMIADVMTGSFVIERIFAIPGIGKYTVESILARNYTLLMGITLFYAIFYAVMLMIVDLLYGIIDPRINVTGAKKE